ncbi:GNAT family N-acetyltransferase [Bacillus sp. CHD6a]|uniref:GNAT family N-acetyltransferase n=1 Tax=Bacillus sp. CHD6a TaxID=1643452 RepID=UPI0006CD1636|nr:GNAT family N-acetyltransferase [Bacillus sp. CHD6a]KPB03271.1 acetyltransferase [Bacillus sp. CHD6a]
MNKYIFESERLILRVFEPEDVKYLERIWGDEEVMGLCAGATPHEMLPKVIEYYARCQEEKGLSVYAVVEKVSGIVIGTAGFNVKDSLEKVELIYHFAKSYWGRGYASEAGSACVDVAKSNNSALCLFASADPTNKSSLRILEKIGFEFKGLQWFDDTNQEEPYYEMVIKDKNSDIMNKN